MTLDVDELLHALDNENNDSIVGLTSKKIKQIKNDILQKLQLKGDELKLYHLKLDDYRYVDELKDIQFGRFIRWIPLNKDDTQIKLTNGAYILDYKLTDNGIQLLCKNIYNRFFQIKFDENLVFQKITNQEKVLLSVMDYLDKK